MPMERARYAENWEELAYRVKAEAGWHCQHCGKPCLRPGESLDDFYQRVDGRWLEQLIAIKETPTGWRVWPKYKFRFVLTVAHLDQNPSNDSEENLRALCGPCHLKHDRPFFIANRYSKRERAGQLNLFSS